MPKLWGGNRIESVLKKAPTVTGPIGESWEISGVAGAETPVRNGTHQGKTLAELLEAFGPELLGTTHAQQFGTEFPLLIKFLDTSAWLSVQVHPDDQTAPRGTFGKSEMWVILDAEPGAELALGFESPPSRSQIDALRADPSGFISTLRTHKARSGEVFNVPAGQVHALGPGLLLAEIQQSSDTTYRLYDFERKDPSTGQPRALHLEAGLSVLKAAQAPVLPHAILDTYAAEQVLVTSPYFRTDHLSIDDKLDASTDHEGLTILLCIEGSVSVEWKGQAYPLPFADHLLLPASLGDYRIMGTGRLLKVTLP